MDKRTRAGIPGNVQVQRKLRDWLAIVASLAIAALVAACSGSDRPAQTAAPVASVGVSTTATPAAQTTSRSASSTITASLFTDPRPRPADATLSVPRHPRSPFPDWDSKSVVLYDLQAGTEKSYGEGRLPSFSTDGKWFAFNVSGVLRLVDLSTGATRDIPVTGGLASFVDATHLYLPGPGEVRALDIQTDGVTPISQITDPLLKAKLRIRAGSGGILTPDEKSVLQRRDYEAAGSQCRASQADQERCRAEAFEQWTITEIATGQVVLEVRAVALAPAGSDELVLATSPQCRAGDGSLEWCETARAELIAEDPPKEGETRYATGTTNIFLINVRTYTAEFIATTGYTFPTWNWPLAADSRHVVWTDSYCGPQRGKTHIYDRSTKRLTDTDATLWVKLLPDGMIGVDDFGPKALLDPATLQWKAVLPPDVTGVVSSPDGRYLAVGEAMGHGGLCG